MVVSVCVESSRTWISEPRPRCAAMELLAKATVLGCAGKMQRQRQGGSAMGSLVSGALSRWICRASAWTTSRRPGAAGTRTPARTRYTTAATATTSGPARLQRRSFAAHHPGCGAPGRAREREWWRRADLVCFRSASALVWRQQRARERSLFAPGKLSRGLSSWIVSRENPVESRSGLPSYGNVPANQRPP